MVVFPGVGDWSDICLQKLHHCHAAINAQYLAGNIASLVGGQDFTLAIDEVGRRVRHPTAAARRAESATLVGRSRAAILHEPVSLDPPADDGQLGLHRGPDPRDLVGSVAATALARHHRRRRGPRPHLGAFGNLGLICALSRRSPGPPSG